MTLCIAILNSPDFPDAEEFSFLLKRLTSEAKKVFDEVISISISNKETLDIDTGYTLLLGKGPVFLSANALRRMRNCLDKDNACVIPWEISLINNIQPLSIYTLSDYLRFENSAYENHAYLASIDTSNPPEEVTVSLWKTESLASSWPQITSTLLERGITLKELPGINVSYSGLYFEFSDYYGQVRTDIIPYLPENFSEVLEIGCGKGLTGELLQDKYQCRVTGVEIQKEIAQEASSRLYRVLSEDVETIQLENNYDLILALDVVEHLHQPDSFFTWARKHLTSDGSLIAVIPNIGHYSIVRDLINGRWDYIPVGIQCITHLRFFTYSTLEFWVDLAGFGSWEIHKRFSDLPEEISQITQLIDADLDSLATEAFYLVARH